MSNDNNEEEPKGAPVVAPGQEHRVVRELANSAKWQAKEAKELVESIDEDYDKLWDAITELHKARKKLQKRASYIYEKMDKAEAKLANVQGIREGLPDIIESLEEEENDEA